MAANPRYDVIGGFLSPVQKDLAPAAQSTRMLELCLGSNSCVHTSHVCTGTWTRPCLHLHRDCAHAAATAPRLGSYLPHLHRDCVRALTPKSPKPLHH
jgi:hypothetical protein